MDMYVHAHPFTYAKRCQLHDLRYRLLLDRAFLLPLLSGAILLPSYLLNLAVV